MSKHLIKIDSTPHGVLGVRHAGRDQQYCEAGELVILEWQPDAKWGLQEAHYTDAGGNVTAIDLTRVKVDGVNVVAFVMPDKDITVGGTFKKFVLQDWTEGQNPSVGDIFTVGENGEPVGITKDKLANDILIGSNNVAKKIKTIDGNTEVFINVDNISFDKQKVEFDNAEFVFRSSDTSMATVTTNIKLNTLQIPQFLNGNITVNGKKVTITVGGSSYGFVRLIYNYSTKRLMYYPSSTPSVSSSYIIGSNEMLVLEIRSTGANVPLGMIFSGKTSQWLYSMEENSLYSFNANPTYEGEKISLSKRYFKSKMFSKDELSSHSAITRIAPQGMDIYGKYMLQAMSDNKDKDGNHSGNYQNAGLAVIDIEQKQVVGYITLDSLNWCHANNVNFSSVKYAQDDILPLVYLSQCYGEHCCYVIRISNTFDSYTIIQTIKYNGTMYSIAFDWFLGENDDIFTLGIASGGNVTNGPFKVLKFAKPNHTAGDITFADGDIVESYQQIDGVKVYQSSKMLNGKVFLTYGTGTTASPCGIAVYDLEEEKIVSNVKNIISGEPEGISIYNGDLIVVEQSMTNPVYYRFLFP